MNTKKGNKEKAVEMTIGPNDGNKWGTEKTEAISTMAKLHHSKRSRERLLRNAMSAVRYRMEEYVKDENVTLETMRAIEDFVKDFLNVLELKKFQKILYYFSS